MKRDGFHLGTETKLGRCPGGAKWTTFLLLTKVTLFGIYLPRHFELVMKIFQAPQRRILSKFQGIASIVLLKIEIQLIDSQMFL